MCNKDKKNFVEKTIQTYENIADDYSKTHSDISEIKQFADFFLNNLKGKKVLDVGAGPGRDAKYFYENGLDVIGIDLTSHFIKIASENVPGVKFIQMDMRDLHFPESSFDGIWANASFLHIPKREAKFTLLGFRKVLKQGGLIYLSVKRGNKEKVIEKDYYKGDTKFFAFYMKDEFEKLVNSCGFRITKTFVEKKKDVWINVFAVKE